MSSAWREARRVVHKIKQAEGSSREKDEVVPEDPVIFALKFLNFKPTSYQVKLLSDKNKRIIVIWSRQSGKTTTLAIRMIHGALHDKHSLRLIVAPGLRQSMIVMDRIQDHLTKMPEEWQRSFIRKMQRTVITFRNGSKIVALPNSPNLLRGYTASEVLCDEAAFFRDDALVFFNVLFPMLQTTDGSFIASSTPWGKDSVFFKFSQDPTFSKHRITWHDVVKAGLAKKSFILEMQRRTPPERFRREYLAEFVEDELAYFPQGLITQCINSELQPLTDDWTKPIVTEPGTYFIGIDFGKRVDFSVIVVLRKDDDQLRLVSVFRFPLETPYASVVGYVKVICDKLHSALKVFADQTGVGEYIVEDMRKADIHSSVEGITLSLPVKQEILGYMKQLMQTRNLSLYYDADLLAEINVERFELTKTGQLQFSHPEGTHDDRLWALALAVYATRVGPAGTLVSVKRRE